jgi:hypothetical protein
MRRHLSELEIRSFRGTDCDTDQLTRKAMKLTLVIIMGYHCYRLHTIFLSSILLSKLSPSVGKIIGDRQCGFRRNRSHTDQIFLSNLSDTEEEMGVQ